MEELSAPCPVKTLHEMYETAVEDPHNFWYVNLASKEKREMFYVRLDHEIVVE